MPTSMHWRLYISANNGNGSFTSLTELEMSDEIGGANICSGGTPSASSSFSTAAYNVSKLFDGIKNAFGWISASGAARAPCWVAYEFLTPVQIKEFRIWSSPNGLTGGNDEPQDFSLQYYDDNLLIWVDAPGASYTGEVGWTDYETRTYAGDLSIDTPFYISGVCKRGVSGLPAQREIYAYTMGGQYIGFTITNQYGEFELGVTSPASSFIRVVDPTGIYSTEIRENIIPQQNILE